MKKKKDEKGIEQEHLYRNNLMTIFIVILFKRLKNVLLNCLNKSYTIYIHTYIYIYIYVYKYM